MVTPHALAIAIALLDALQVRVVHGQVTLRFESGQLVGRAQLGSPAVERLAIALRDTFGPPIAREAIELNFHEGALKSIERHADYSAAITTSEFFRVETKKALARGST